MILVTGGAGFIGSNLIQALRKKYNDHIVMCDSFGYSSKWKNLPAGSFDEWVAPEVLLPWLEKNAASIKTIFHMGAITASDYKNVDNLMAVNYGLSKNLIYWCLQNHKRLIYASSASVYGDGKEGFKDGSDLDYTQKLNPLNAYGWSKLLADVSFIKLLNSDRNLSQGVGLRFFNVYGKGEDHKADHRSVVTKFYNQIVNFGSVRLFKSLNKNYADGEQRRDFTHVDDCIDTILWFYDNPSKHGIFNCATGKARTFLDVANIIFKVLNKPPKIEYIDTPVDLVKHYQHFTQADLSNLREVGYTKDFTDLEEGIEKYIKAR